MPRANARQPLDPGLRLAFDSLHGPLLYQCDSVDGWQANVRSIALGLEALRAVDRYGITRHAEQYTGWRQIGAGPSIVPDAPLSRQKAAEIVLRAARVTTNDRTVAHDVDALLSGRLDVVTITRRAQRAAHPDMGGSAEEFDRIQRAIAVLRGTR